MVDTDALLSSSPSLIWLQLGFGLARAVTTIELMKSTLKLRKITLELYKTNLRKNAQSSCQLSLTAEPFISSQTAFT